MNPILLIFKGTQLMGRTPLKGDRCLIGRHKDCQVFLAEENAASRQHAVIDRVGSDYFLEDQKSRNGTLLNGKPLTLRVVLREGDEITIGETRLKVTGLDAATEGADGETRPAPSEVLGNGKKGKPAVQAKPGPAPTDLIYKLTVQEGPTEGVNRENWSGALTIGKAIDNEFVLIDDDLVSSHHAQIVREGAGFAVEDLDSTNGTFVNRRKIQRHVLATGDRIKIGKSVLLFEVVDQRRRKQRMLILLATVSLVCLVALVVKALLPPDQAGELLLRGRGLLRDGRPKEAAEQLEIARKMAPGRADIKAALEEAQAQVSSEQLFAKAQEKARSGDYLAAQELCFQILRTRKSNKTKALLDNLKVVIDAGVAINARNWQSAQASLEQALQSDPGSLLIQERIAYVKAELVSMDSMRESKQYGVQGDYVAATNILHGIPETSVYLAEARSGIVLFEKLIGLRSMMVGATNEFREGRLTNALEQLRTAESLNVATNEVVSLRKRIEDFQTRYVKVQQARGMFTASGAADNVDILLQVKRSCQDLLDAHGDPANQLVAETRKVLSETSDALGALGQRKLEEAKSLSDVGGLAGASGEPELLLKPENIAQGKKLRAALEAAELAARAMDGQETAADLQAKLRKEFERICRVLMRHAVQLESVVGDADARRVAQSCYRAIVAMARPGDAYQKEAEAKIR